MTDEIHRQIRDEILERLTETGIAYSCLTHAPAHTMAECAAPAAALQAVIPANLFLRPRRHEKYYLLLAHPDSRLNTSSVSRQIGSPRLSFASEDELFARMRARSGSASPLGFLFPEARDVTLLVDRRLPDVPRLGFHPCDNTATLAMDSQAFFQIFLPYISKEPIWVDMEG